jgi:uncharacterized protein (DUF433 family)
MIRVNPKIMMGKPVIQGTRVTVELIKRKLAEGLTPEQIVEAYPTISIEDVREALVYESK